MLGKPIRYVTELTNTEINMLSVDYNNYKYSLSILCITLRPGADQSSNPAPGLRESSTEWDMVHGETKAFILTTL